MTNHSYSRSVKRRFLLAPICFLLCLPGVVSSALCEQTSEHASNPSDLGPWSLTCRLEIKSFKDCAIGQSVSDSKRGINVHAVIGYLGSGQLHLTMFTNPLRTEDKAIALLVDDFQIGVLNATDCNDIRCKYGAKLEPSTDLAELLSGDTLTVQQRVDKHSSLSLSLDLHKLFDAIRDMYGKVESHSDFGLVANWIDETTPAVVRVSLAQWDGLSDRATPNPDSPHYTGAAKDEPTKSDADDLAYCWPSINKKVFIPNQSIDFSVSKTYKVQKSDIESNKSNIKGMVEFIKSCRTKYKIFVSQDKISPDAALQTSKTIQAASVRSIFLREGAPRKEVTLVDSGGLVFDMPASDSKAGNTSENEE